MLCSNAGRTSSCLSRAGRRRTRPQIGKAIMAFAWAIQSGSDAMAPEIGHRTQRTRKWPLRDHPYAPLRASARPGCVPPSHRPSVHPLPHPCAHDPSTPPVPWPRWSYACSPCYPHYARCRRRARITSRGSPRCRRRARITSRGSTRRPAPWHAACAPCTTWKRCRCTTTQEALH